MGRACRPCTHECSGFPEEAMVTSRGLGSQTTDMGLRDLLTRHLISEEEALFHATDREAVLANRGLPTRDRLRR